MVMIHHHFTPGTCTPFVPSSSSFIDHAKALDEIPKSQLPFHTSPLLVCVLIKRDKCTQEPKSGWNEEPIPPSPLDQPKSLLFSPILLQSERVMGESLPDLFWSSSEGHEECNDYPQEKEGPCCCFNWYEMVIMALHFKVKTNTFRRNVWLNYVTQGHHGCSPFHIASMKKERKRVSKSSCMSIQDSTLINQHNQPA